MACTNCQKTAYPTNCSSGCVNTIDSDCVIYDGAPLPFEGEDVETGDKRTLSSLLQLILDSANRGSKIIEFNSDGETDNGDEYDVVLEDTQKVLLITQTDDEEATVTYTINLPQTEEFIDKQLIIKDITNASVGTTVEILFNIDIQYEWDTVSTTDEFAVLMDSTHKTLSLRFVKVSPTSYAWIVCP